MESFIVLYIQFSEPIKLLLLRKQLYFRDDGNICIQKIESNSIFWIIIMKESTEPIHKILILNQIKKRHLGTNIAHIKNKRERYLYSSYYGNLMKNFFMIHEGGDNQGKATIKREPLFY